MIWQQLIVWVVTFILTDYFRERLPGVTASGLGDFAIPTATEGRVVPLLFGNMRSESPNCIWYGDFAAVERTVTTGVIFKRDETIGYKYELALQYALCKNPVAGITGVWIGDDQVFEYVADAGGVPQEFVDIDRDDLFGGPDEGGGFQGRIRLHNGSETQGVSAFLASRLDPLPAYRGTAYIVVSNIASQELNGWQIVTVAAETKGANIGESNQLRYIRVAVQAFDTVANGGMGDSMALLNDEHFIGEDINPISLAFALYTDDRWGRSFPPSDVDLPSFQAANATCYTEGIGFSQVIDEQTTTGEIQDTIEQHIDGYIGPNPVTGRIEVTLARQDYTPAAEFQASQVNTLSIKKWSKGDWSQTWNRVRIRYTDRAKQWNETHAVELAPGNLIIQGGRTKTKELRFQGVHTASVASKMAARTRRGNAQPIASGTIELDRTAYQLRPGSIIVVTNPKIGESNLNTRVTKAGVGSVENNTMEFEVVSDVFDIEVANVTVTPPSDFVPPVQAVIPFTVDDQAAFEGPFILMRFDVSPNETPRIVTLARRNVGNVPTEYEVIRRTRNPPTVFAGGYTSTDVVKGGFCVVGTLRNAEAGWQDGNGTLTMQVDPIGAESLDGLIGTHSPTAGGAGTGNAQGICVISPGQADEEFIVAQSIVDDGLGIRLESVWRAAMDTPMKPHALGARVWFIWTGGMGLGPELYNLGDGVDLKLLPRSPNDALTEPEATSLTEVLLDEATGQRAGKPLLPITLSLNGVALPGVTDTVDFEVVHTTPSAFTGAAAIPQLRDALNQSILGSVMGLDLNQTAFDAGDVTGAALEVQWWLHDLDTDPAAGRANALAGSAAYVAQATAADQFDITLASLIAGGAEGFSFNARLEVETRHSPAAFPALDISHEAMDLDFIASGIFSVLPDAAIFQASFDGVDASTAIADTSKYVLPVIAGGTTEIDTAQSVFGGASLLVVDAANNGIVTRARRQFDMRGNFTVECRLRFTSEATFPMIFEQWENTQERGIQVYYQPIPNTFSFNYSTNGTALFTQVLHTGTFVPTLNQWYAFAMVKNGTQWSCYIDGTRLSAPVTQASAYYRSSADFRVGGGGDLVNFWDGHIDEFRLVPVALYNGASYTVDTVRFPTGTALYPLLANMNGTNLDTVYPSDDATHFQITAGGTSEIDTSQFMFGTASLRCDDVGNLTPALCDGAWLPETVGYAHPAFDFKRGNWTMELFFRVNVTFNGYLIGKNSRSTGGRNDWSWSMSNATTLVFSRQTDPANQWATQTSWSFTVPTISAGVWYHAAMVRVGADLHAYFNGNRVGLIVDTFVGALNSLMFNNDAPGQDPLTSPGQPVTIGRIYGTTSGAAALAPFDGWIDAVNIVKEALYNGSTYTIPIAAVAPLNDGLGPVLADDLAALWLGDGPSTGYATDREIRTDDLRGAWITFNGSNQILTGPAGTFGPNNLAIWFQSNGGANWTGSPATYMDDDDFTLEARCYFSSAPDSGGGDNIISQWFTTGDQRGFHFTVIDNAGPPHSLEFHWSTTGIDDKRVFTAFTPALNTWYHLAVVRSGTSVFLFVDGVVQTNDGASDAIGTDIIFYPPARVPTIGHLNDTGNFHYFHGYMQNIAWTRSAKWVAGFTPPAALYTPPQLPNF